MPHTDPEPHVAASVSPTRAPPPLVLSHDPSKEAERNVAHYFQAFKLLSCSAMKDSGRLEVMPIHQVPLAQSEDVAQV